MSGALGWALPALPTVAGGLLAVGGRRADRPAPAVAVAVAAVTAGLAVAAALLRPSVEAPMLAGLPVGMAVDGMSSVLVVTVSAVTLAVLVFAAGEMPPSARFHGLMLVFSGAMLVTVTATDLLLLLMAWEVMGAMSYALIGFWWREDGRVRSADTAFLTTRTGDLGLYLAAGAAFAGAGTLSLDGLEATAGPWRNVVAAGLLAAALGKSAQLPFSFWLSRAMAGPSPVSALLHSATMVAAGAYLLLRTQPLLAATGWAAPAAAWAGAATALLLGTVALAQSDLKQLLAASTSAQLGFMVLAAGTGAVAGGTAHLVAHAAVKSLLFLVAGAWLAALGTKDLGRLHGVARRHPFVGAMFTVGALALAGIPPLSLWITKDTVLDAALRTSWPLYAVGLAATVLSAAYAAKAMLLVWLPADDETSATTRAISPLEKAPLPPLALVAAGFGLVVVFWTPWHRLVGGPPEPPPALTGLAASAVLVLMTFSWAVRRYVRGSLQPVVMTGPRWASSTAVNWLHLERAVSAVIVRPVLALAGALARFDDRIVDGAVRASAAAALRASSPVARRIEAGVDGAVHAIAASGIRAAAFSVRRAESPVDSVVRGVGSAARRLGRLARRPQTGQVHIYYVQAVVLLFALAAVLVLLG
ncbi:NADH-quinone oxidoreductase subunit 5 family protein [Actinocorallia populi]|uniref:NADH-quinone oxidoreductase subunit 5 family protein n=1 Tax=Actinocorallia populi TaxID=2079200 RepID=UPI000D0966D2|nr:proton-conducting transporter membrane subunit [Actinocorallia populi]